MKDRLRCWGSSLPVQLVFIALVSRLGMVFAGWYTLKLIPPEWEGGPRTLLAWARWDGIHYARIAMNGYDHPSDPGSTAFFPLYPLLVKVMAIVLGQSEHMDDYLSVGVVIAWILFLLAVALLTKLFEMHLGPEVARTAALLLIVSPYSFFLSAAYTESLFLALVASTYLLAERHAGRLGWFPAAIAVALATATRVTGVFLIPTLLFIAWRRRASLRELTTIAVVSPLGLVAYMAYTWWALGDPLAFLHAQSGWGGFQDRTWIYVQGFMDNPPAWFLGDPGSPVMFLNMALFVMYLVSLVPMVRMLPIEITIFSAMVVLQTAVSIQSMGRYLLPAIGTYMVLALLIHRSTVRSVLRDAVVIPSSVMMTMLFLLFAEGKWIV